MLMESGGHEVAEYTSEAAFLAGAGAAGLAGIVVDHDVAQIDGLGLLRRLRGDGLVAPAVLITGPTPVAFDEEAARLSVVVLRKPLLDADLLEVLAAG